jgi:hypothetical protein
MMKHGCAAILKRQVWRGHIEDAVDDDICRVSVEDVLFPDAGSVWFPLWTDTGAVDSVCSEGSLLRFVS